MKLKIFTITLAVAFIVILITGQKNLNQITYTQEEVEEFNKKIGIKTVREEKEEEFTSITSDLLLQLKNKKIDTIIKRKSTNSKTIGIADQILKNQIYIERYWEPVEIIQPTWLEDPYNDDSWKLYYQSLDFVSYLINAYEVTGEIKYLEKANYFIFNWIQNNREYYMSKSTWAWTDHSSPNRVLTFIQFWKYYKDSELYNEKDAKELVYSLKQHGKFIYDDELYSPFNHGIMQDQSLLELSILFSELEEASSWEDKARKRLLIRLQEDFAPSGVHKEHTPSYHSLVTNLFTKIKEFADDYGEYNGEYDETLNNASSYSKYLINPRGEQPLIGDTKLVTVSKDPLSNLEEKAFVDGGVAFLRNNWIESENPLSLVFTSAFHSTIHKHADDLSFTLDYGDTDYFVDGGQYNYDGSDPYRKYFRSVFSHNSIAVNDENYSVVDNNIGKSEITAFYSDSSYSYVSGIHEMYPGVKINRTIIYLKPGNIIIHDTVQSETNNKYTQIFNLGKEVNVSKISESEFTLTSNVDSTSINLKQLDAKGLENTNLFSGEEDPVRGWQSYNLNEKHPITSLYFNKEGTNHSYMTLIALNNNKDMKGVKYKNGFYTIEKKNGSKIVIEM